MEAERKELFDEFSSITGCKTNRKIAHYLEACGFDLAMAVDLYFAQGGADPSRDDDDVAMITDDEEEASCAQSTSRSSRPKVVQKNGHYNNGEVRAPIPSTRGTMIEAGYSQQYGGALNAIDDPIFQQRSNNREAAIEQERHMRNALTNAQAEVRVSTRAESSSMDAHRSMLQDLFKPPTDINFCGSFETAKEYASDAGKWLLINVQDLREFACQTLNRDIWSNDGIKELIRTNFLFWQIRYDSVDGQRLKNYYKIKSYPAIFILDPRTGELTHELIMKKQDPVTLCDYLTSFLDKYPDFFARDKQLKGEANGFSEIDAFSPGNVPVYAAEPECSRSAMFDEEGTKPRKRRIDEDSENGKRARISSADILNEPTRMLTVVDKDDWLQEVATKGEVCKIRLKLPDGRLETIEITSTSRLKALFVFIAGRNLTPKDHIFVLSFPRREFSIDGADISLADLGFSKNEMVHVESK